MSIPVTVLKYACVLASSNEGLTAISLAGGPVAGLIARFGSVGILSAIDAWSKPDISEDEIAANLMSKGMRVTPLDPATMFGGPA